MDEFEFGSDDEIKPSAGSPQKKESVAGTSPSWARQSPPSPSPKRTSYGSRKNRPRKSIDELDVIYSEEREDPPDSSPQHTESEETAIPAFQSDNDDSSSCPPSSTLLDSLSQVLLKGRTAKRRTRNILRTGADAMKEGGKLLGNDNALVAMEMNTEQKVVGIDTASHSENSIQERPPLHGRKKKRRLLDFQNSPSDSADLNEESSELHTLDDESAAKILKEPPERSNPNGDVENIPKISESTPQSVPRGRRHKRPKASRNAGMTPSPFLSWDESKDSEFSTPSQQMSCKSETSVASTPISKNNDQTMAVSESLRSDHATERYHSVTKSKCEGTPDDSCMPPSSDKSVRFSLSSNTSHFYQINSKKFGTPPGSPDINGFQNENVGNSREIENTTENYNETYQSEEKIDKKVMPTNAFDGVSNADKVPEMTINRFTSKVTATGEIILDKLNDGNDTVENSFKFKPASSVVEKRSSMNTAILELKVSHDKNKQSPQSSIEETVIKKLPPSCLKSKPTKFFPSARIANSLSTPDSSPSSRSSFSASSYGSSRLGGASRRKKARSRRFNLGYSLKSADDASEESIPFEARSPDETPNVSLGRPGFSRDASAVQDAGNLRMLIDELSYLCSAILHCKMKSVPAMPNSEVICKHTSITAGAACDLAEIVSQAQTRSALLTLGGKISKPAGSKNGGTNVGALGAVLEAIACAPQMIDCSEICREIIWGRGNDQMHQSSRIHLLDSKKKIASSKSKPVRSEGTCRTKNARRKQVGAEDSAERDSFSVCETKPLEERAEYDGISSNALSIVAHFVGVDCTGSERSAISSKGQLNLPSVKAARKSVLQHKAALQGLARLVADDHVAHAYLRKACPTRTVGDIYLDGSSPVVGPIACARPSDEEESCIGSVSILSSQNSELSIPPEVEGQPNFTTPSDPTKSGRRKGRKKKQPYLHLGGSPNDTLESISEVNELEGADPPPTDFDQVPSSCIKVSADMSLHSIGSTADLTPLQPRVLSCKHTLNGSGKSNCLDFLSEDGTTCSKESTVPEANGGCTVDKVELNSGLKFQEKISLAISRAKLVKVIPQAVVNPMCSSLDGKEYECPVCNTSKPRMIPLYDEAGQINKHDDCVQLDSVSASSLALDAAECIISGKDKTISSSAEDTEVDMNEDDDDDDDFLGMNARDSQDDLMSKNPILYANEMLRKSGSLQIYSRSMADTLLAIILSCKPDSSNDSNSQRNCSKCISYLQQRASSLSGIIDNLCCLSPEASKALSCTESILVPSLLRVIAEFSFLRDNECVHATDEAILTALKTLTSLTHENTLACEQVLCAYHWDISTPITSLSSGDGRGKDVVSQITGLEIIISRLFKTVTSKRDSRTRLHNADGEKVNEKSWYDSTIFCLNILTNVVEMVPNPTKSMVAGMIIRESSQSQMLSTSVLSWLSRWIVFKTSGFRNAVMKGSFGSTAAEPNSALNDVDNNEDSELKAGEEGNLVTAGNGFILLAYLMLDDDTPSSLDICDVVIEELPIDRGGNSGGIQFMIKTLKAFCNFYHYTVGDLSVAVITPVVKLIAGLKQIDLARNPHY